jgi:hypothetical protein
VVRGGPTRKGGASRAVVSRSANTKKLALGFEHREIHKPS